ncbi:MULTISPECIES: tRNA uridine-5-carboxymethylaminomethyl(34) synthesis enzyme MnmG [Aminobacterium]|uniref:tRNA uridine-5-carboxymethylaminomethyl(34) synthesis enzyme MnmG n=1 Tax=Aminobacterium TaxID=81466 RepID=UPI00046594C0|nr:MULTISPECIES: tRNA uridine-5-carboxymethylaminomethyl(34) synthesis enzyme MnmG [Aminobacterium]
MSQTSFDVIVVGGGHAGCEAALAAARMGARTLMLNLYLDNTALMPCNPSIGGPAKGHLVREGNALGGEQARAADASTMLIRWLNTSKGPAVQALRAQCDLHDYRDHFIWALEVTKNLEVHQDIVTDLWVDEGRIRGVKTRYGFTYEAGAVILTTGTYLKGRVHIGLLNYESGPMGQMAATDLSCSMREHALEMYRMRTDTTPRIHLDTIDTASLLEQNSAEEPLCFDLWGEKKIYSGYSCYLTRTHRRLHDIIRENLERSPLWTGRLQGLGPRYCPSIEDKVIRFPEKDSHLVFLEPVSRRNKEVYLQNFSTSLPYDVQVEIVHALPGCEKAQITRAGYAIEYDYVEPTQLMPWLETKKIRGLFCAGQINGTSGYEEAGAQGLMAGINAVLSLRKEEPLVLERSDAYIGVLIDDLVTKGTEEPYRMLTSRCEYRLLLRFDNADRRLAPIGRRLGLIDDEKWTRLLKKWKNVDEEKERLSSFRVLPSEEVNQWLRRIGSSPVQEALRAWDLLCRPEVTYKEIETFLPALSSPLTEDERRSVEIEIKYAGYIERQERQVRQLQKSEKVYIPEKFCYEDVPGLLTESLQKLKKVQPRTLGQASRISGVTPADIQLLSIYLETRRRRKGSGSTTA